MRRAAGGYATLITCGALSLGALVLLLGATRATSTALQSRHQQRHEVQAFEAGEAMGAWVLAMLNDARAVDDRCRLSSGDAAGGVSFAQRHAPAQPGVTSRIQCLWLEAAASDAPPVWDCRCPSPGGVAAVGGTAAALVQADITISSGRPLQLRIQTCHPGGTACQAGGAANAETALRTQAFAAQPSGDGRWAMVAGSWHEPSSTR